MSKWSDLYERIVKVLRPKEDPIGFKLLDLKMVLGKLVNTLKLILLYAKH